MKAEIRLEKLRKELDEAEANVNTLEALMLKYPDLEVHMDRWNRSRYASDLVNADAKLVHIYHSCGCCADSPTYAWPYLLDGNTAIYHGHGHFEVGQKDLYCYGENPRNGWREEMVAAGCHEDAIAEVEAYFAANEPECDDEDSPEDSE